MTSRRYITTAIDYPNAPPHMGHVLEKVMADVCARWMRLKGDQVRFQIGTDEHGIKIQRAAEKEGITPQELVDRNVPLFQDLYARLSVSFDHFIRTTDRERHWPTVQNLWRKLRDAGLLEKRTYTGLYCAGCERFLTPKDLVDGKCPLHLSVPEEVKEENWFFRLSQERDWLRGLLTEEGGYRIIPDFRAPETLSLIDQGLEDVSFSRPVSSLSWGIPVPDDQGQVMYVWCDALANYISGLGFFTDVEQGEWWNDAEVTHVIGKDIARFHALIWPAMLKAAGVRSPDRLLIHGFLTSEGQKMSKSLGNVVQPEEVLKLFGGNADPLRFYLSHEIPVGNDGDFSWKRIRELYAGVLANKIGNLLNRILVLLHKDGGAIAVPADPSAGAALAGHWSGYAGQMDETGLAAALAGHVVALAMEGNLTMDEKKPWSMSGPEKTAVLSSIAEKLRHISLMLLPFMPETAQKISVQLGVPYAAGILDPGFRLTDELKAWGSQKEWKMAGEPAILFPPLSDTET